MGITEPLTNTDKILLATWLANLPFIQVQPGMTNEERMNLDDRNWRIQQAGNWLDAQARKAFDD